VLVGADREWLVEHRYRAVQEVLSGQPVTEVAARFGVSRQSVYAWKNRYQADGLGGLREGSRRPHTSPARLAAEIEAQICELRRAHPRWGARRISFELGRRGAEASRATVHRVLVRNGLVDPHAQRRKRKYKRWQRDTPMQLWQLDIVDGMKLASGRGCKIVTGVDDHSRFAVVATVVARPTGRAVCAAFIQALQRYGVPEEVLTDNGKQFTGRHTKPRPVEVLFERICRTEGIDQKFTKIKSPTTTGKIERFHQSLQLEFLDNCGTFADLPAAQAALDGWVDAYNHARPHQSLDMATPASRFHTTPTAPPVPPGPAAVVSLPPSAPRRALSVSEPPSHQLQAVEVHLLVPPSGSLSLAGRQEVWVGRAFAGRTVQLWADQRSIHVAVAGEHFKTVPSRLSAEDLLHLTVRGARPAGPQPAGPALDPQRPVGATVIEVHRTADRNGVINIGGQRVTIGAPVAGQRIVLRLDGHLMHIIAAGHLVKTLPTPVPIEERIHLVGAQLAHTPLPPPVGGSVIIRRRVPTDGVVMVSRQRLRVGRVHAGKTVTIAVEDTHYRVQHNNEELSTHPRDNHNPIRTTKAHAPRRTATPATSTNS
jgi:transposase InsO family protein